ncbi:MAG: coproporphyrinogen III oxidase, partial [Pseudomonadota bacterium]
HGRLTVGGERIATEATRRPSDYMMALAPTETTLTGTDTAREFLAMALRPVRGLDLKRFESLFGHLPEPTTLATLNANGLAELSDERLTLTAQGRLMADYIAGQLTP